MTIKHEIENSILELIIGDITTQDTEAIANAANRRLSPGGGVSGAIHRAAGPQLWEESKTLGGCYTGEAKLTKGYNLKAKYVIHTVGPVYSGSADDSEDLKNCYKNSLLLASRKNIKSISFPSISTGVFGYPVKEASMIALKTIIDFLKEHTEIELVRMALFSEGDYNIYKSSLEKILKD
ncbi:MAG: macro domain-containing protein [Actinobacteria bacterium]|nr:macro domain-containing protein [Actinomycetota bacterium]